MQNLLQRVLKKHGFIKGKPDRIKYNYVREHEEEFVKDWVEGVLTQSELEEKYKCPYTNLYSRSNELNIYRKSFEETDKCKEMINDWITHSFSNTEICTKYDICESTLHNILRKNNINIENKWNGRQYFFNEKYFDDIDDEHKAYWLGFIYADGYHNPRRYSLSITLQEEDNEILQKFYQDINCNRIVDKIYNKQYNKFYVKAYVQHPHLSKVLFKQGVPNDKSFKIRFPSDDIVPYELKRHFIRGYLDGDGCITIPQNKSKIAWSIIGNYDCMNEMKQHIEENILNYSINIHPKDSIYTIGKCGRFVTQTFLDWLYKDATIYLQRKYDKYLAIIEYNKEKENEQNGKIKEVNKSA